MSEGKATCPICGKSSMAEVQPFCSRRCADVDLGHWLTGQYRVPSAHDDMDEVDEDRQDE
jgi:uncharacterized protein